MAEATWPAILAAADRLEPEARQRFLHAIARLRRRIDVDALVAAIVQRQPLDEFIGDDLARELIPVVESAFRDGWKLAASQMPTITFREAFDRVNPLAVTVAQETAASLVVDVTAETTQAIRSAVVRGLQDGLTRREMSSHIRPLIGLTERQALAVINYRFSLLESGLAGDRVSLLADIYADRLLRRRAETIARTQILTASNAGQHAAWQAAIDKGLLAPDVERTWIVTPDDRLCPYCMGLEGEIRGMDEEFSDSRGRRVLHPPLHPNCRCVLRLVVSSSRRAA